MSTRRTINIPIYFNADSDDVATGYQIALDIFCSTSEQGEKKSSEQAAGDFVESFMAMTISEDPETVAASLYGAARFFLEVAGKPVVGEVKS